MKKKISYLLSAIDYKVRGKIAIKFPSLRSVCYRYMSTGEIINYEITLGTK
jgi:hypothetical protein